MPNFAHIYKQGPKGSMFYCWFSAMHTRVDLAIAADALSQEQCMAAAGEVLQRVREIERLGNCFDPTSQLSLYNTGRLQSHELTPELQRILSDCQGWREQTGGLFDVAFGGRINLSGYLKGYAIDAIRQVLHRHCIVNALVNMGNSSILALGNQPGGTGGWLMRNSRGDTVRLRNECLTTSGNDTPERRHIVNPLTGQYVEGQHIVSVVTATGAEGEVRATVAVINAALKTAEQENQD